MISTKLWYLERSIPGKERSRRMVIGGLVARPSAWSGTGSWHNGTVLSFLVVDFGLTQIIHFPAGPGYHLFIIICMNLHDSSTFPLKIGILCHKFAQYCLSKPIFPLIIMKNMIVDEWCIHMYIIKVQVQRGSPHHNCMAYVMRHD